MTGNNDHQDMKSHRCSKHQGDPITEFSLPQQTCMCLRCATMQHENFSEFVPVREAVQTKREEATVLLGQISELSQTAKTFQKDRRKFLENVNIGEKRIKGVIKKVKANLIRHIDIIESKLVNTLTKLANDEKRSILNVITEVQDLEKQLTNKKEHLSGSLKHGSDVDVIMTVVSEKKGLEKLKQTYDIPEDKLAMKTLHIKLSPAVNFFLEKVDSLGQIDFQDVEGELTSQEFQSGSIISPTSRNSLAPSKLSNYTGIASSSRTPLSHISPKESYQREKGAVVMRRPNMESINNRSHAPDEEMETKASIVFTEEHEDPCNLTGVVALESSLIVVADAKHKCIQLLDRKSEIHDDLIFHYIPCSLVRVSGTSFAISYTHKDFISVFNVARSRFRHVKDLRIGGHAGSYSLAFSKNKFAVCRKLEIRVISYDDGSLLLTIPIQSILPQIAMSDGGTKIYITDLHCNKVICMTDAGKTVWEFSKGHVQPCGLALDLNQLFIADRRGRVFILSIYGTLVKEINCGGQLQAISIDKMYGNVLLTQESRDNIRSRTVKIVSV